MSETLYRGFLDSNESTASLGVIAWVECSPRRLLTCPSSRPNDGRSECLSRTSNAGELHAVLRKHSCDDLWSTLILGMTIIGYAPLLARNNVAMRVAPCWVKPPWLP